MTPLSYRLATQAHVIPQGLVIITPSHTNFKTTKSNVPGFSHNNKPPPFSSHLPKYSLYSHLTTTFLSPLSPSKSTPIHTPSLESVFHHYLTSLQIPLSFCCCCCWSPSWLQTCQVAHVGLELQSFLLLLPKYHERIPLFTPLTLSKASIFPHDFASSSALTIGSKEAPHVRKT